MEKLEYIWRWFIIKMIFFGAIIIKHSLNTLIISEKIREMLPWVRYKKLNFDSFSSYLRLYRALPPDKLPSKEWKQQKKVDEKTTQECLMLRELLTKKSNNTKEMYWM